MPREKEMRWDIDAAFIGPSKDATKVMNRMLKSIKKELNIYLKDAQWSMLGQDESQCVVLFEIAFLRF